MLLQIPAGWFAARWGSKSLISCQCMVISAVLLALPAAARRGAWAAGVCLFTFGLAQAPFSVGSNIAKANWVPTGKERAWALMLISLGTTLSKNISSVVTPWLSGRNGWRAVTTTYAASVGVFMLLWQLLAAEHPQKARSTAQVLQAAQLANAPAVDSSMHQVAALSPSRAFSAREAKSNGGNDKRISDAQQIGIWKLLRAAPTMANILNHMQHDMHEFQVIILRTPLSIYLLHGSLPRQLFGAPA